MPQVAPVPGVAPAPAPSGTYVVKRGDTLYSIALDHGAELRLVDEVVFAALLLLSPIAAHAEEAPDLCVDRPGLGTPTCTLEPGRVMVEFGALQWEHTAAPGARDDTITLADTLVRIGLGGSTDLQVGLGGWGHARSRAGALSANSARPIWPTTAVSTAPSRKVSV